MGQTAIRVCVAAVLATAGCGAAAEPWGEPAIAEVTGRVAFEGRAFLAPPRFPGQRRHGVSVAVEPELYLEWDDYTSLTAAPFLRLDSADPERSHGDVRELYLRIVRDDWELGLGIGKLFWGVVESFHLVDVVNQTDLIENIDLEDKLGQPMVNLTLIRDWGYVDMVYMPLFRDRTFQGRRGRLRNALVAAGSLADHEPGAGRWYPGLAVRYSNSFGAWDAGVYQFHGLAREPSFGLALDAAGAPVLAPFYEIVNQTGADVQYTAGAWLWKLEALLRQGQRNRRGAEENYAAAVGGFEYTVWAVLETGADLGLLVEYLHDSRGDDATGAFQNDVFAGARLALNDPQDTSLLAGAIRDLSDGTSLFTLEASRRIGDRYKLTVEARLFSDVHRGNTLADFRDEDMIQVELGYFF